MTAPITAKSRPCSHRPLPCSSARVDLRRQAPPMAASTRESPAGPRQAVPVLLSPPSRSSTRRGAPLRRPKKQPRPSAPLHASVVLLGDRLPSLDPALSRPLLPASLSDSFPCSLVELLSLFFSSGNGNYHYSPWSSAIDRLQRRPTRSGLPSPSPRRCPSRLCPLLPGRAEQLA